jgi:hypothetical protein
MELNKKEVLQVFSRNFPFKIVETPLGTAVKMPARDAFIFSAVTGAGYFSNPVLPFSPKGLLKLFYNAFDYKFVSGIFENTALKNTPYILAKAKPYLFDKPYKYIVPIEFYSESELQDFLSEQFEQIENPTDFLILRIEKNKVGNGMESFMEYLAGEHFKRQGFVVENQVPLAHALGSPDFGGYTALEIIGNVQDILSSGFHIIELAMIRLSADQKNAVAPAGNLTERNIVGEAKTGTKIMTKQLLKYLDTGLFDFGFEIHPFKDKPAQNFFGLLSLDENFEIVFYPPEAEYVGAGEYSKETYQNWLTNYMKFYLLANFTNDEFNVLYQSKTGKQISSQKDIIDFVCGISTAEIITKLNEVING